ncbi:hypothetical protein FXO37_08827 [Capsicum annuum]|nr:hypothetical protein FXO37_08827 [Capsicum annuum]
MQSLSFNFKGGTKLSWRSGVEVSRQQRGNVKIMACVPESESRSSSLSRSQTYALLKQQMDVAAKYEDYKEAARLRDSLKIFEDAEPVLRLRRLVKEAIAEERFEDAARFRDELKNIAPHSLLKCSSDATTLFSSKVSPILDCVKAISRSQAKYYIKTSDINISTYGLLSHMARNKLKLIWIS